MKRGSDLRYAVRMLRRSPGLTVAAVLTLTLGIGANAVMFSVVSGTLLVKPPFPRVERLMTLWEAQADNPDNFGIVTYPNYLDWAERSTSFEQLALFDSAGKGYNLSGGGQDPEQVSGVRVSASFFAVLGVAPLLGRTFEPDEEVAGRDKVVVLSHRLWQRRFGGDENLVGRTVPIDAESYTVIGVMPPDFQFQFGGGRRELWVPAGWTEGDRSRTAHSFFALGRLAEGVGVEAARAEMDRIGRALAEEHPDSNRGETVAVIPAAEYGLGPVRAPLIALLAVVGFVLLIACVNVANLMLAQATARRRELAIRGAMGAGRGRLVRQLLTESVVLSLAGGLCGLAVAALGVRLVPLILPGVLTNLPLRPVDEITLDVSVVSLTFALTFLAGVLFGVAPAWASSRGDLVEPLKESARGSTAPGGRLRYALVSFEVGLTVIVLAGAGLMVTSLTRLLDVDPGLDPEQVLVMLMSMPQENLYYGPPGNPRFCEQLTEEVGSLPGVVAVSGVAHLPLSGSRAGRSIILEGREPDPDNQPGGGYSLACPGYLETMGIPLVAGREFTVDDRLGTPGVVIVNESMAEANWPDQDAVGQRFKLFENEPWLEVVGVHADVRHLGLASDPFPSFLRPYAQAGWPFFNVLVKTASAPHGFERPVREALGRIDPSRVPRLVRSMDDVIHASVGSRRFPMQLLSGFALLALALAAVGIAGVVSYSVAQSRHEIGIRLALGARAADVLGMVVGRSMLWTLGGLAVGLLAGLALLRVLDSLLYGVSASDPSVLAVTCLLLSAVALLASLLPALRATRVDPVEVLRSE